MGSPQTTNARAAEAGLLSIVDPGAGGSIVMGTRQTGIVSLVTAAAEARTLNDPTQVGQQLTLGFKTDGGDCTVTASSAVNQTGNTVMTFADAGDMIQLVSIEDGSSKEWRVVANDGVALS